uniref:DEP domain-containing protein n=1 Tax=Compsopogon caeruleus TaxID=31354 RepID=A0A7S1TDF8_9RHOD
MEMIQDFLSSYRFSDKRVGLRLVRGTFSGANFHEWMKVRRYETPEASGLALSLGQQMLSEELIMSLPKGLPQPFSISAASLYCKIDKRQSRGTAGSSRGLVASSRGLRRSLEFIPRRTGRPGLPLSPADPMSSINSGDDVMSSADVRALSGKPEGLALREAQILDTVESLDIEGEDEVALASFDPIFDDANSTGELYHRKGVSLKRQQFQAEKSNVPVVDTTSLKREKSIFGQYADSLKESREWKKLLRDNTKANRSSFTVQELVAKENAEPEEHIFSPRATAPLCSSQWLDTTRINLRAAGRVIQPGDSALCSIRFNEKTTVYKLDEEGTMIETIRIPIDYSIKKRLREPAMKLPPSDVQDNVNLLT